MALRNLNVRTASGARVCSTPHTGLKGAQIPADGEHGPSFLYNDIDPVADAAAEVRGVITTPPVAGTLIAYEDGSFIYTATEDGTDSFVYQLEVFGVPIGPLTTVELKVGNGITIHAGVGRGYGYGQTAIPQYNSLYRGLIGNAAAAGRTATVTFFQPAQAPVTTPETNSDKKPSIPAISNLEQELAVIISPIKENIEILTGIRSTELVALSSSATTTEIITALNGIIARLNASGT